MQSTLTQVVVKNIQGTRVRREKPERVKMRAAHWALFHEAIQDLLGYAQRQGILVFVRGWVGGGGGVIEHGPLWVGREGRGGREGQAGEKPDKLSISISRPPG